MNDVTQAFGETRSRIIDIATSLDSTAAGAMVPACPAWTVRDLLAHVAGVSGDILTGNVAGAGSDEWTRAQIEARAAVPVVDLVAEIATKGGEVEGALEFLHPAVAGAMLGDLVTHEHDLRGALGRPGARDSTGVNIALDSYVRFFGRRIKDAGRPAVAVESDGRSWVAGAGEPGARVMAPRFPLLRALTGRRTHDEIRAFSWDGDPEVYVSLFSMYGVPERSLGEDE